MVGVGGCGWWWWLMVALGDGGWLVELGVHGGSLVVVGGGGTCK